MGVIVAVIFDQEQDAHDARANLKSLEKEGRLALDDAVVIAKGTDGKIHMKNEMDKPVVGGALIGGFFGLLLAFMFPFVGLAIGAIGGALVGKSLDDGVDKRFIKEVTNALQAGKSALIVMVREADATAAIAAFKPFKGTIYQTSISTEAEESLRSVLKD